MSPLEKMVVIPFDEIGLKRNLSYDPKLDVTEGFEDYGEGNSTVEDRYLAIQYNTKLHIARAGEG